MLTEGGRDGRREGGSIGCDGSTRPPGAPPASTHLLDVCEGPSGRAGGPGPTVSNQQLASPAFLHPLLLNMCPRAGGRWGHRAVTPALPPAPQDKHNKARSSFMHDAARL